MLPISKTLIGDTEVGELASLLTGDTVCHEIWCWLFGIVYPGRSGEDIVELATLPALESEEATVGILRGLDPLGTYTARRFLDMVDVWRNLTRNITSAWAVQES